MASTVVSLDSIEIAGDAGESKAEWRLDISAEFEGQKHHTSWNHDSVMSGEIYPISDVHWTFHNIDPGDAITITASGYEEDDPDFPVFDDHDPFPTETWTRKPYDTFIPGQIDTEGPPGEFETVGVGPDPHPSNEYSQYQYILHWSYGDLEEDISAPDAFGVPPPAPEPPPPREPIHISMPSGILIPEPEPPIRISMPSGILIPEPAADEVDEVLVDEVLDYGECEICGVPPAPQIY
jgi:hypothetical protein